MYSMVLLAGGIGSRMKRNIPKQYLLLAGKPMILHILERIEKINKIDEIVIVCNEKYIDLFEGYKDDYLLNKKYVYAKPGDTRQGSVYNGLKLVKNEKVVIHEAVRPFVTVDEFENLINDESENSFYGKDIAYTVLKGKGYVDEILDRSELINVQLPQKFNTKTLMYCHEKAAEENKAFTEDASMVKYYTDEKVKVLPGTSYNLKITEPVDLVLGELIYKEYIIGKEQ